MANLIDNTYFIGEISLPAQVLTGTLADINPYIVKYERQALIDLVGYTLYKELLVAIAAGAPDYSSTKWKRLITGHEYGINYLGEPHLVKWNGLINSDKVSLLAYYIYYYYLKFHVTHTSGLGELVASAENAAKVSASQKMTNAWNRFIELRGIPSDQEIDPTCYNFLNEFEDDETNGYDPWLFVIMKFTNSFGI